MRPTLLLTPIVPWLFLLASCSAPPKPPAVDESRKRPANSATAVELQTCRSELRNTQLRTVDTERLADRTALEQQRLAAFRELVAKLEPPDKPVASSLTQSRPNLIATVHFEFGSTRVVIPPGTASTLISHAKTAPLVLLRGRTDGTADMAAEGQIARSRAAAVADYLVAAGVHPSLIRATYQPIGDHATENNSTRGRATNRRVEIEIYRAVPEALISTEVANPRHR